MEPRLESIAIVGAGLTGLTLNTALRRSGYSVTLFEKSRGLGGRISERRDRTLKFAHGALYPPGRSALQTELSSSPLFLKTTITALRREGGKWALECAESMQLPHFDWVLLTAPAPQSAKLLEPHHPEWTEILNQVLYHPAFSILLESHRALGEVRRDWMSLPQFDSVDAQEIPAAFVVRIRPSWIEARLREGETQITLTQKLLEQNPAPHADRILGGHLWKFATCRTPVSDGHLSLIDKDQKLGVAGDAFGLLGFDTCRASAFDLATALHSAR